MMELAAAGLWSKAALHTHSLLMQSGRRRVVEVQHPVAAIDPLFQ